MSVDMDRPAAAERTIDLLEEIAQRLDDIAETLLRIEQGLPGPPVIPGP